MYNKITSIVLILFNISFGFYFCSCSTPNKKHNSTSRDLDKPTTQNWRPQIDYSKQNILVKSGKSLAPIYVSPEATPRTIASAKELATYMEKISGVAPLIIYEEPKKIPSKAIWVGMQAAVKKVFPGVNFDFQNPEEILIHSSEDYLVIAGRDRWVAKGMHLQGRKGIVKNIQQEYGTCNAIYTFLQDYLMVRWLGPGSLWEDVIPKQTISIPLIYHRYYPQLRSRDGVFRLMALGENRSSTEEQSWARRQRLQYSSLHINGGHAFKDWWDKYHKQHPNFFALLPNGKREPIEDPIRVKLCLSNSAVWEQWIEEVEEKLLINPSQRIFNASPNDGWNRGHCTCEHCQAWDAVPLNSPAPNLADRQLKFANKLAGLLVKKYPEKDYYVQLHSYGYARKLPLETEPHDRVLITSVHHQYLRDENIFEEYSKTKQQFIGWSDLADNLVWRPNMPNYAGHVQGMPDIALKQAYTDIQFAAKLDIQGIWIDTYWDHWSTQSPQYYLLSQLMWNPYLGFEEIMSDFYTRAYGAAADEMQNYWEFMEKSREKLIETYPEKYSFFLMYKVYDDQWLKEAQEKLSNAYEKVQGNDKLEQRIQFHEFGLMMVGKMLELQQLQNQLKKGFKEQEIKNNIDSIWEEIVVEMNSAPKHAFNQRFVLKGPNQGKTRSMHYNFQMNRKVERTIKKYRE